MIALRVPVGFVAASSSVGLAFWASGQSREGGTCITFGRNNPPGNYQLHLGD